MGEQAGPASGTYTHGYSQHIVEYLATRKADVQAAFILPSPRPSMRLLTGVMRGWDAAIAPSSARLDSPRF
jgi:hypothetical protein